MLGRLISGAIAFTLILALAVSKLIDYWESPLIIGQEGYALNIDSGATLSTVSQRLHSDGVFSHPLLLRLYGRWTGQDLQIKRGEYQVPKGTTPGALLRLLQSGKVVQYQVTLPEGITLARATQILTRHPHLRHTLGGPQDERLLKQVEPHTTAEGLFFPDTYHFERGATDWDILQRAYQAMATILIQEWESRADGLPYDTPYEALIMASIVERETGLAQERDTIAGVFTRRLQKRMRLQTDPTVIYGLGASYDGDLRRRDLRDASNRYNTYRHFGLPPSPIALPGRAAIHAALNPEQGDALYFVARGDGGHQFSRTLAEHQQAVKEYQLKRRADYRSSPGKIQ